MIAYTLTAAYTGTSDIIDEATGDKVGERPVYLGGEIAIGDGTFNIGAAIDAGGGTFAVNDANQALVAVLDEIDALKRTTYDETIFEVGAYTTQPKRALQELAEQRGLPTSGNKAELAEALEAYDRRAGGLAAAHERDAATAARLPADDPTQAALDAEHERAADAEREAAELTEAEADRQAAIAADEDRRRAEHEATVADLDDNALETFVGDLDDNDDSLLAQIARGELEQRTAAPATPKEA